MTKQQKTIHFLSKCVAQSCDFGDSGKQRLNWDFLSSMQIRYDVVKHILATHFTGFLRPILERSEKSLKKLNVEALNRVFHYYKGLRVEPFKQDKNP